MSIPVHIAIDLETMSLRPNAVIMSVGLAAFTLHGGLAGTYYVELDKMDQIDLGRDVDQSTLAWWRTQPKEASFILDAKGVPIDETFGGIDAFFSRWNGGPYRLAGVWGYGSDFDNAALQDLYRDYGLLVPWPYKVNRCGRTAIAMAAGNIQPAPKAQSVQHHALDDAIWQAERIRQALISIGYSD